MDVVLVGGGFISMYKSMGFECDAEWIRVKGGYGNVKYLLIWNVAKGEIFSIWVISFLIRIQISYLFQPNTHKTQTKAKNLPSKATQSNQEPTS